MSNPKVLEKIVQNLNTIILLTDEEKQSFTEICRVLKIGKKEFVFHEGDVCSSLFFINSGLFHVYFTADGNEKTCQFFSENRWYTDFSSYLSGTPTVETFQALEKSEIVKIEKADLERVYRRFKNLERAGRILAEKAVMDIHARNKMLTLESPEDRYLRLIREEPDLINRIPQYHLASYLNIKPESLSRIKKRMTPH